LDAGRSQAVPLALTFAAFVSNGCIACIKECMMVSEIPDLIPFHLDSENEYLTPPQIQVLRAGTLQLLIDYHTGLAHNLKHIRSGTTVLPHPAKYIVETAIERR
jgi:hypothetical protein